MNYMMERVIKSEYHAKKHYLTINIYIYTFHPPSLKTQKLYYPEVAPRQVGSQGTGSQGPAALREYVARFWFPHIVSFVRSTFKYRHHDCNKIFYCKQIQVHLKIKSLDRFSSNLTQHIILY